MDGAHLALLFSKSATIREARSGFPDAPQVEPEPTFRERRAARLRARAEARSARAAARAGRTAVRSAERVVRAARPAARSESPTGQRGPQPAGTQPTDPTGLWW